MSARRTVLAVVLAALREQRSRLLALARLAETEGSEELVHDARVALRRLAAVARLSRGVPEKGDGETLRLAARDLRRRLSSVRTAEVCRALLVSRAAPGRTSRDRARRLARELFPGGDGGVTVDPRTLRGVARLASARIRELMLASRAGETGPELEARLARRVERRSLRAVKRLARVLPPRPRELHPVRIAAKHARYAVELARPFLSEPAPLLVALKEFQELAGDAHDRQELEAALAASPLGHPDLEALRAGIAAETAAAAARARASGQRLLALLSSRPPRWREATLAG